jgi:hypothetical protein
LGSVVLVQFRTSASQAAMAVPISGPWPSLDEVQPQPEVVGVQGGEVLLAPVDHGGCHDGAGIEGHQQFGHLRGGLQPMAVLELTRAATSAGWPSTGISWGHTSSGFRL